MGAYVLHLAILAGIYIILTVSINLIIGYAGQVSLGHAAFYGIGAYASALVSLHWHFPFPAAALAGDAVRARELDRRLEGLHTQLFVEANPIPIKWAVERLGLIPGGIRLPLTPLSARYHASVQGAMQAAGIV